MFDEDSELRQDLSLAEVEEENSGRRQREIRQDGRQLLLGDSCTGKRLGDLGKAEPTLRGSDKSWIVVCNQRPRDDRFDGHVTVNK